MVCPDDAEPAARSYSMNIWASGGVDNFVRNSTRGTMWGASTKGSSNLILITEKWSHNPSGGTFFASAGVGYQGDRAGQRFGAGGGVPGGLSFGRFGTTKTEIDYTRHRRRVDGGKGNEPIGRINIGFADGHVQSFRHSELADFNDPQGKSRLVALWSPRDYLIP
jgi:prepilin-type processing-associated H-X9-DG protein